VLTQPTTTTTQSNGQQQQQQQHNWHLLLYIDSTSKMVSFLRPSSWTRARNKSHEVVTLASLAEQGKFDKLLKRLNAMDNERFSLEQSGLIVVGTPSDRSDNEDSLNEEAKTKSPSCTSSSSLLHVALAHRAPLRVVEALLDRIRECCITVTSLVPEEMIVLPEDGGNGKTPLHVAAECGCDVNVIERLLNGETLLAPAYTKDQLGRYPLHWACCLPYESKDKRKTKQKKKTTTNKNGQHNNDNNNAVVCNYYYPGKREIRRETIYKLLHAYPVAAVIPDVYGRTPLDYARRSQLDPHSVHALATVAKVHGDVHVLARRGACKKSFVGNNSNNNNKPYHHHHSTTLSRNSSETTERESTDQDDDDSPVGHDHNKDDEQDDASSSSSSNSLPEGTMSYGEILLEHDNMDDVSTLGCSQENDDETESVVNKIVEPVATYVPPFSAAVKWQ
jgi:Ankyrin repeats (3 copies)